MKRVLIFDQTISSNESACRGFLEHWKQSPGKNSPLLISAQNDCNARQFGSYNECFKDLPSPSQRGSKVLLTKDRDSSVPDFIFTLQLASQSKSKQCHIFTADIGHYKLYQAELECAHNRRCFLGKQYKIVGIGVNGGQEIEINVPANLIKRIAILFFGRARFGKIKSGVQAPNVGNRTTNLYSVDYFPWWGARQKFDVCGFKIYSFEQQLQGGQAKIKSIEPFPKAKVGISSTCVKMFQTPNQLEKALIAQKEMWEEENKDKINALVQSFKSLNMAVAWPLGTLKNQNGASVGIIMDYFPKSQTLDQYLRNRGSRMTRGETANIAWALLKGFSLLHDAGIVIRDPSHNNILVSELNVGLAFIFIDADSYIRVGASTENYPPIGTPGFFDNSHIGNIKQWTQSCDIFGITSILFRVLCGHTHYSDLSGKALWFPDPATCKKLPAIGSDEMYISYLQRWLLLNLELRTVFNRVLGTRVRIQDHEGFYTQMQKSLREYKNHLDQTKNPLGIPLANSIAYTSF